MSKRLRGKVARILSTRTVVITLGRDKGVRNGMLFDVVEMHEEIKDPDTDAVLGTLERRKVRVKVVDVQDKLSVASTYRSKRVNRGGQLQLGQKGAWATRLLPAEWVTEYETLEKRKGVASEWDQLSEEDSYVNVGDVVIQILEEDLTTSD